MRPDPHPEIGGRTVACTCHSYGAKPTVQRPLPARAFPPRGTDLARAFPPEHDGLTAADAQALIDKEIG